MVDLKHLPPFIKFIFFHLMSRLEKRAMAPCKRCRPRGDTAVERFRTDAKADGGLVTVGGYQTFHADGTQSPTRMRVSSGGYVQGYKSCGGGEAYNFDRGRDGGVGCQNCKRSPIASS